MFAINIVKLPVVTELAVAFSSNIKVPAEFLIFKLPPDIDPLTVQLTLIDVGATVVVDVVVLVVVVVVVVVGATVVVDVVVLVVVVVGATVVVVVVVGATVVVVVVVVGAAVVVVVVVGTGHALAHDAYSVEFNDIPTSSGLTSGPENTL